MIIQSFLNFFFTGIDWAFLLTFNYSVKIINKYYLFV